MKIIDKRGRLFGLISIIDVVVIVVVALLAVGIYMRFFSLQSTAVGQPTEKIAYTLLIENVRQYTVDAFREGDTLWNKTGSEALGTITDISVSEASQWGATADGTAKKGPIEGKYNVTLTLDADGVIADGRYYVSRTTELGVSQAEQFTTKYATFTGTVAEIGRP